MANDMTEGEACDYLLARAVNLELPVFDMAGAVLPQGPLNDGSKWLNAVFNENWWREGYNQEYTMPGTRISVDAVALLWRDVEKNFGLTRPDAAIQPVNASKDIATLSDDPRWPEELGIALTAWRAACNNAENEGKRPGAYIREWLAKLYPTLSDEAVKRIATVSNWDKSPGVAKK